MVLRGLHICESLSGRAGDVSVSVVDLAAQLGKREGRQFLMGRGGEDIDGVEVAGLNELERVLADVDVVHVHSIGAEDACLRMMSAAKQAGVGVVFSPLGALGDTNVASQGWFGRRKLKGIKRLVEMASFVTGLNAFEVGQLNALGADVVETLVYGVNVEAYAKVGREVSQDEKVLLYLGRIEPSGGVVVLMRALAGLGPAFDGWRLVVAGNDGGDWVSQLKAGVLRKGAGDRVSFVVGADLNVQREWLRRADAVVVPSMTVRCPVVVGQALAAGVPVLATELGLPDQDVAGLRRCATDQAAIGCELASLLGDVGAEVSAAGTVFDAEVMVDTCLGIYERCCAGAKVG